MRTLKVIDEHNYEGTVKVYEKFSVRAIIRRNGKIAMQKSEAGEYKILGGGVEKCETYEDALAREVREESGLVVIPSSIREIGEIIEIRRDRFAEDTKYINHSLYYFCDAEEKMVEPEMTESEIEAGFHLVWADYDEVILCNSIIVGKPWIDRDTLAVRMLRDGELG